jgi:1-acyl-sn-glycerol-3-phosphate acyltransferase
MGESAIRTSEAAAGADLADGAGPAPVRCSGPPLPRPPLSRLEAVLAADFIALGGFSPRAGRLVLRSLLRWRLRQIARDVARFDLAVERQGPAAAMAALAAAYSSRIEVAGAGRPPGSEPLLIVANHPGIFDSFALFSTAGRADLIGLARPQPLFGVLPAMTRHLVMLPDEGPGRAAAARAVLRHLQAGRSAFIFPAGRLEPEPALAPRPDLALGPWLTGAGALVRIAARRQRGLLVVPAAIQGVISARTWRLFRPLIGLRPSASAQRDLATLLQIIFPRFGATSVTVRYGAPRRAAELAEKAGTAAALVDGLRAELRPLLAAAG